MRRAVWIDLGGAEPSVFFVEMEMQIVSVSISVLFINSEYGHPDAPPSAFGGGLPPTLLLCRPPVGGVALLCEPGAGAGGRRPRYFWASEEEEARARALPRGAPRFILADGQALDVGRFDERPKRVRRTGIARDPETGIVTFPLVGDKGTNAGSQEVAPGWIVDFDEAGKPLRVEVLSPDSFFPAEILRLLPPEYE